MSINKKIISFGGYAASGGSALRDILKGREKVYTFPTEFRILKERYGLLDLENALYNSKSPENIDLAIKDFIWLSQNFARKFSKFKPNGLNYDFYTGDKFSSEVKLFINNIVDYKYLTNWHMYDFKKKFFLVQSQRYAKRLFKNINYDQEAYMSYPTKNSFIKSAKKLISNTLKFGYEKEGKDPKFIALHNAINPYSLKGINLSKKYFDNIFLIIIDRDPRDIFLDFPQKRYLPYGKSYKEKAKNFINFYLKIRKEKNKIMKEKNILFLQFENLILNYEYTIDQIRNFIDEDIDIKNLKKDGFDPVKSSNNIKKFKNASNEIMPAIKLIEDKLNNYLYKED